MCFLSWTLVLCIQADWSTMSIPKLVPASRYLFLRHVGSLIKFTCVYGFRRWLHYADLFGRDFRYPESISRLKRVCRTICLFRHVFHFFLRFFQCTCLSTCTLIGLFLPRIQKCLDWSRAIRTHWAGLKFYLSSALVGFHAFLHSSSSALLSTITTLICLSCMS